jgi:hypothetical protein
VGSQTGGSTGEIQPPDRSDAANPTSSGLGRHGGGDAGEISTGCRSGGGGPASDSGGGRGALLQARGGGVEPPPWKWSVTYTTSLDCAVKHVYSGEISLLEKSLPVAHLIWLPVAHMPCAAGSTLLVKKYP